MRKTKLFALLLAACLFLSVALADTAGSILNIDDLVEAHNGSLAAALQENGLMGLAPLLHTVEDEDGYCEIVNLSFMVYPSEEEEGALVVSMYSTEGQPFDPLPLLAFTEVVNFFAGDTAFTEWFGAEPESCSVFEGPDFSIEYGAIVENEAEVGVEFTIRPL